MKIPFYTNNMRLFEKDSIYDIKKFILKNNINLSITKTNNKVLQANITLFKYIVLWIFYIFIPFFIIFCIFFIIFLSLLQPVLTHNNSAYIGFISTIFCGLFFILVSGLVFLIYFNYIWFSLKKYVNNFRILQKKGVIIEDNALYPESVQMALSYKKPYLFNQSRQKWKRFNYNVALWAMILFFLKYQEYFYEIK